MSFLMKGTPAGYARIITAGPTLAQTFTAQSSSLSLTATTTILLGVDWTATQSSPVHCFTNLSIQPPNNIFFWDSQSTGEGIGVRWSWRGEMPLLANEHLIVTGSADATITWAAVAWAVIVPQP